MNTGAIGTDNSIERFQRAYDTSTTVRFEIFHLDIF